MRTRDIKLTARKHLEGSGIVILEGPAPSVEHRMVAQYEAIVDMVDELDMLTHEIGRNFLNDLAQQDPDNITLKCLRIINRSAFEDPSLDDCAYLVENGRAQIQYCLNVYQTVEDGWQCAGKKDDEIAGLKAKHWPRLQITQADLDGLKEKFRKAGKPVANIEPEINSFIARCKRKNIEISPL